MLYQELNKTLPFDKRMEHIYDTAESFINFAISNSLDYYICGGVALMIHNGSIYRENEDLEISINFDQKNKWFDYFNKNGYKFEKDQTDWPFGNQKKRYRSKRNLKIEVILIKDLKEKNDHVLIKVKDLNVNINSILKIFEAKMAYTDKDKRIIRTKDKLDILHFKQYLIDNLKNS